MEIAYLVIGYIIAGAHYAWAEPRARAERYGPLDMHTPHQWLVLFCVLLVGPFWPVYLAMLIGAVLFRKLT